MWQIKNQVLVYKSEEEDTYFAIMSIENVNYVNCRVVFFNFFDYIKKYYQYDYKSVTKIYKEIDFKLHNAYWRIAHFIYDRNLMNYKIDEIITLFKLEKGE
jgi:hypothetical protein